VRLSPSSIIWYRLHRWDVNRHTTRYTGPVSMVSQCKNWCLAEGLRKRRSAPPYGPQGSVRTLRFLRCLYRWSRTGSSCQWFLIGSCSGCSLRSHSSVHSVSSSKHRHFMTTVCRYTLHDDDEPQSYVYSHEKMCRNETDRDNCPVTNQARQDGPMKHRTGPHRFCKPQKGWLSWVSRA